MTNIIVGIVFGGASPEHHESIRATRILYNYAIKGRLEHKYTFKYFYLTKNNQCASSRDSKRVVFNESMKNKNINCDRMIKLDNVDIIYSTMMGSVGENGNIMGLADLLKVPIIGSGILASALTLNKYLSKLLAKNIGVPTVPFLYVDRDDDIKTIENKISFPCFVKPVDLGTCAFVFRANNKKELRRRWYRIIEDNYYSNKYLIEKFIPNVEVRIFIYEDMNGSLHTNDKYVTELKESALKQGGGLFNHMDNKFPREVREQIVEYAKQIFRAFQMKDYARIDFFVELDTNEIYFNEANTQPFIGSFNIKLMEKDGIRYHRFLDTMIQRNLE